MKKDSIICFRVSKELHKSLIKIAHKEKRSLSSIIEIVLTGYTKDHQSFKDIKKERRQFPRKSILAPALIKKYGPGETKLDTGSITDISLTGLQITIPRDTSSLIIDAQTSKFEIIFTLPNKNRPIYLTCELRRIVDAEDSINVGASYIDANFQSYKALQTYLM